MAETKVELKVVSWELQKVDSKADRLVDLTDPLSVAQTVELMAAQKAEKRVAKKVGYLAER